MTFTVKDHEYMQRAIRLAWKGRYTTSPNPRVGCVLVMNDNIVGEGAHLKAGEEHAEVHALAAAGEFTRGATAYVTLEPCSHFGRTPPCAKALIEAGVQRVVIGMVDPNPQVAGRGVAMLQEAGVKCESGLLEDECRSLNPGFISRMSSKRPWVTLKLAASLDGRTALSNGESKWITSTESRRDVQRQRAESCAILSTATTVIRDNASLNVRPEQAEIASYPLAQWRQPIRIILDRQGKLTGQEQLFNASGGPVWLVTAPGVKVSIPGIEQIIVDEWNGKLDLMQLMIGLAQREINNLWLEAGATLAGSLIEAGLVDRLQLYLAPKLMGNSASGLLQLPVFSKMDQVPKLDILQWCQVGPDLRITASIR